MLLLVPHAAPAFILATANARLRRLISALVARTRLAPRSFLVFLHIHHVLHVILS